MPADCRIVLCTANQPGAIAIIELIGYVEPLLCTLTGRDTWSIGAMHLARFADIDEGLAVRLKEDIAQLMPHGGPRVVQRLIQHLIELGGVIADDTAVDPLTLYPEAADEVEAIMLHALARAHSPLAIDLLLDQPRRWSELRSLAEKSDRGAVHSVDWSEIEERSARLNHLITPPLIVLAGPANVGKSTLSNALLGRAMSIAVDQPGTTRDYTIGMIDLGGLVVRWFDTPGLRETDDPIEKRAIELAHGVMQRADFLIAMTDHELDPPNLPRTADLVIANKTDLAPRRDIELNISALNGDGVAALVTRVRDMLVPPDDLKHEGVWLFDKRLQV